MKLTVSPEVLDELLGGRERDPVSEQARRNLLAEAREFSKRLVILPAPRSGPPESGHYPGEGET